MPDQPSLHLVDMPRSASVSFAPPDPVMLGAREKTSTRAAIAVGPGRAETAEPNRVRAEPRGGVTYPILPGKIQAPALRDETLARTRLLDWLDVKIHSRVVFVIADAGYGKTTLLADFSRRTRVRTIWYRIDEDDRDWVGFLAHLVSAGREFDPAFAPRTAAILRSLEPGGPTREDAIEAFLDELPSIAADGAALILDDFHLADEVADIRLIAREIVARGPERLTVVFASRRAPAIPVAKLRSLGELAELGIADLRFSDSEMEQLFRETYRRPLEPDVLTELAHRTEGWAASLTLVQAALRERTPAETRSFVRSLSGARDELHDYLAEEVVGDLPAMQQQFLMRTSILQRVTPELAQVATDLTAIQVQSMIGDAERLGMLGRRANRRAPDQRYHPLVREFLEDRLRRAIGDVGVDDLHLAIARWAEPSDWRTAAHHYAASERWPELIRVLDSNVETIVASGAFAVAADFLPLIPGHPASPSIEIVRSRVASLIGDTELMLRHAQRAAELAPMSDIARSNLIASTFLAGDIGAASALAFQLEAEGESEVIRDIGAAIQLMIQSTIDGDLPSLVLHLEKLSAQHHEHGRVHYEGVSLLNASLVHKALGDSAKALETASRAVEALEKSSSGAELVSARLARAWAIAWAGDIDAARLSLRDVGANLRHALRVEFDVEFADLEVTLGDAGLAERVLDGFVTERAPRPYAKWMECVRALVQIRQRRFAEAKRTLADIDQDTPSLEPAHKARVLTIGALAAALARDDDARGLALEAISFSSKQGAYVQRQLAMLVLASIEGRLSAEISETPSRLRPTISLGAELVLDNLDNLSDDARDVVSQEASIRPERWQQAIRMVLPKQLQHPARLQAAHLLDKVGDKSDVPALRLIGREMHRAVSDKSLGRELARRLAPRVTVMDLGRVRISIGAEELVGGGVRRKVLALLCFLLTRPQFTATREQVMDSLWPEIDPDAAANSLNQTMYFLRRVFEPDYDEDLSPGYLRQEGDLVLLDRGLVTSASSQCAALIARIGREPDPELVSQLSGAYAGRFASDFAYDEWAVDFRDWLHVAYLQIIEDAIASDIAAGKFSRGVGLARRALEMEPRLESLGLSLLRLLKGTGAHAAAAEQYERYAALLRAEIGIEASPYDSI